MRTTLTQRVTRLTGATALAASLALSTGAALAHSPSGLTACDQPGCAIASAAPTTARSLAIAAQATPSHPGDPFAPHLFP